MRTLQELAQEALDVQNACNLCGVAQGFARTMIDLGKYVQTASDEMNHHPIAQLWIDKMCSLCGIQSCSDPIVTDTLNKAYDIVYKLANPDEFNK